MISYIILPFLQRVAPEDGHCCALCIPALHAHPAGCRLAPCGRIHTCPARRCCTLGSRRRPPLLKRWRRRTLPPASLQQQRKRWQGARGGSVHPGGLLHLPTPTYGVPHAACSSSPLPGMIQVSQDVFAWCQAQTGLSRRHALLAIVTELAAHGCDGQGHNAAAGGMQRLYCNKGRALMVFAGHFCKTPSCIQKCPISSIKLGTTPCSCRSVSPPRSTPSLPAPPKLQNSPQSALQSTRAQQNIPVPTCTGAQRARLRRGRNLDTNTRAARPGTAAVSSCKTQIPTVL